MAVPYQKTPFGLQYHRRTTTGTRGNALKTRNVAILIFDDVEVLDFAGRFEVFSVTHLADGTTPFKVYTVALESRPIKARNDLSINPRYTIEDCPRPDIVVVPGGYGTRREMRNDIGLQ